MNNKSTKTSDAYRFLKSLHEDGIEEIYIEPKPGMESEKSPRILEDNTPLQEKPSLQKEEGPPTVRDQLIALREEALNCTKCQELASARKTVVFGSGNVKAKLMFIGEAPGHDEDVQGLPFVGKAGQLLTKIIESIGVTRSQVFIANVLRCRPPENRAPRPDEVLNCEPFLTRTIDLIRPKIICALGAFAAQALLKTGASISQMRGRLHDYRGIPVICTYHPAYLLRNPADKRKVWEDMKKIKKELEQ